MKPAEDADPFHVRVYNTLTPLQRLTLAGLAYGEAVATIANWRRVRPTCSTGTSTPWVDVPGP